MMDIDDKLVSSESLYILYSACITWNDVDLIIFPLQYYSKINNRVIPAEEIMVEPCEHIEPCSKCYRLDFLTRIDLHFPKNSWTYEDGFWLACLKAFITHFS